MQSSGIRLSESSCLGVGQSFNLFILSGCPSGKNLETSSSVTGISPLQISQKPLDERYSPFCINSLYLADPFEQHENLTMSLFGLLQSSFLYQCPAIRRLPYLSNTDNGSSLYSFNFSSYSRNSDSSIRKLKPLSDDTFN